MKLEQYLEKKTKRMKEQELIFSSFRQVCQNCKRPTKACLCENLKPFETNSFFSILMHPKEARKQKVGTGRLTNYCLKKSNIIIGENFDECDKFNSLIENSNFSPFVLYPGENSINLSDKKLVIEEGKKPLFFIIDGTWACAKSMMRDSTKLNTLPYVSFTNKHTSKFTIKHQPDKYCLSTIESAYYLIQELQKLKIEQMGSYPKTLLDALGNLVNFQKKCAEDPTLPSYRKKSQYKEPSERRRSKKWDKRKICYDKNNY